MTVVACLIVINMVAARKGVSENFCSKSNWKVRKHGPYDFPVLTRNWKFGFISVMEMLIWACATVLLLAIAIVPVILFLLNGMLLRHFTLVVASLIFRAFHLTIVKENI